ncbi:hypothetical protein [Streptomyces naganishii]|nr:hypothetical protein [Streptomyces naganishii]
MRSVAEEGAALAALGEELIGSGARSSPTSAQDRVPHSPRPAGHEGRE